MDKPEEVFISHVQPAEQSPQTPPQLQKHSTLPEHQPYKSTRTTSNCKAWLLGLHVTRDSGGQGTCMHHSLRCRAIDDHPDLCQLTTAHSGCKGLTHPLVSNLGEPHIQNVTRNQFSHGNCNRTETICAHQTCLAGSTRA